MKVRSGMTGSGPGCPYCGSSQTRFRTKAQEWECESCERRFAQGEPPSPSHPVSGVSGRSGNATHPKAIFFSYGHDANRELVDRFREDLERRGHRVWIDYKEIGTWDDWRGQITRGIHESQMAIAFISIHSTHDPGVCRNEIAMAMHHFGKVYPVLVEPVPQERIPATISHLQWPDLSRWRQLKEGPDPQAFDRFYEEKLLEIIERVEGDASRFAGEIDVLRSVLLPADFDRHFAQHLDGFMGRTWCLEAFESWLNQQPQSRVFWLKAGPGFGKTALAVQIANRFRGAVVAAWFSDYRSDELSDPLRAIRTLAFQLALRWDDYRVRLLARLELFDGAQDEDIRQARKTIHDKSLHDLFDAVLLAPMNGLTWRENKLVIVLDALDEVRTQEGRNPLAELVSQHFIHLPPWVAFLVTSRNEETVGRHLRRFRAFDIDTHDTRHQADLEAYAHCWIEGLALEKPQREHALKAVLQASAGSLLYLRQLQDAVREGLVNPAELNRAGVLPQGLSSLYLQWFEHRFAPPLAPQGFDAARALLALILAAREPLPLALAARLLNWQPGQPTAVDQLGSLCTLEDGRISLFHASLRDWLLDPEASGRAFHVSAQEGHRMLATGLLKIRASGARVSPMIDTRAAPESQALSAAQNYGDRHLPAHLRAAGLEHDRAELLRDFGWALSRCAAGALDEMLHDYAEDSRGHAAGDAARWAQTLLSQTDLLKRGHPEWPTPRILLQIALEDSDDSPLTQAAQTWLGREGNPWPWLHREDRPAVRTPSPILASMAAGDQVQVAALAVSWPTQRVLVGCSRGVLPDRRHFLRVLDLELHREIALLDCPGQGFARIWISECANQVMALMDSGERHAWTIDTGEPLALDADTAERSLGSGPSVLPDLPEFAGASPVSRQALSQDGRISLIACKDGSLWRWRIGRPEGPQRLRGPGLPLYGLATSRDGRWSVTVGEDAALRLWDETQQRGVFSGHAYRATQVCLRDDGRRALSAGGDGRIVLWDLGPRPLRARAESIDHTDTPFEVTALALAPGAEQSPSRVLVGDLSGAIRTVFLARPSSAARSSPGASHTGQSHAAWQIHDRRIWSLVLTPSGGHGISASDDGQVRVWDSTTGLPCAAFETPGREALAVAVSPDGSTLLTAGTDRVIRHWNLAAVLRDGHFSEAHLRHEPIRLKRPVRKLLFIDPQGYFSAGDDGLVQRWTLDGTCLATLDHGTASARSLEGRPGSPAGGAYALALSPCGRYLACSGRGRHRAITLWDVSDPTHPEWLNTLPGGLRGTHFLAFESDGDHLWSAGWDETIVRWNWRVPQGQRVLERPQRHLSGVALLGQVTGLHAEVAGTGEGEETHPQMAFVLGTALGEVFRVRQRPPGSGPVKPSVHRTGTIESNRTAGRVGNRPPQ